MPADPSAAHATTDYDMRSLQHERRMLETYRRRVSQGDTACLQPLANAAWRASMFEWALYRDAGTVRRLWAEAARTLAEGFTRSRAGFDPSPDQFVLALHFAIASRERDAFTALASSGTNLREGLLSQAQAFRGSRPHFHLAEGYALVASALVERRSSPALAASASLVAAREESESSWWDRQFPDALDAAWRMCEHEAVCLLLESVARRILEVSGESEAEEARRAHAGQSGPDFSQSVDETLRRLEKFVELDSNHHPKLYVWLPGLALCALAVSAALPMEWLDERHAAQAPGYTRLPLELLRYTAA